jgi:hypothetical protein
VPTGGPTSCALRALRDPAGVEVKRLEEAGVAPREGDEFAVVADHDAMSPAGGPGPHDRRGRGLAGAGALPQRVTAARRWWAGSCGATRGVGCSPLRHGHRRTDPHLGGVRGGTRGYEGWNFGLLIKDRVIEPAPTPTSSTWAGAAPGHSLPRSRPERSPRWVSGLSERWGRPSSHHCGDRSGGREWPFGSPAPGAFHLACQGWRRGGRDRTA